jgi:hypothetical protein
MNKNLGASSGSSSLRSPEPPSGVSAHAGDDPARGQRVIDYINAATADGVMAEYQSWYAEDGWDNAEAWDKFKRVLNGKIGINRTDNMRVIIGFREAGPWGDAGFDVGGADDEHANWSLSFTPWGEWKLMSVEDRSGKMLTADQIAAHLYYEICWYGWEEQASEVIEEVKDRKEAVDRGLCELVPFLPSDRDGSAEGGQTGSEADGLDRRQQPGPPEEAASPTPSSSHPGDSP